MLEQASITYRVATTFDHAIVVEMLTELVDELNPNNDNHEVKDLLDDDIRAALLRDDIRIFLAECNNTVIGLSRGDILYRSPTFRLRKEHRCGYVDQMYVRQGFRARGIGAQLLQLCEQWFQDCGLKHCLLHAAPDAVNFYSNAHYFPNREMVKRL